ncbi:hypothetical protein RUM44_009209 [Polyplax serrata]|uniref:G-protein coupled receptors family 1 profile domain-containing protein n=1 Tax=Polyplax serrata TaxID=468196 RepID=A0ABR1ATR3_POLSC
MFIIVVLIFIFCWLPYHGYFIYAYHNNSIAGSAYVQHVFLFFYWLAMSNAMVNPIIYYWMNAKFRVYFQRVICCCFRPKYKKNLNPAIRNVGRVSSHSDLARSKTGGSMKRRIKHVSVKWPNQVEESRFQGSLEKSQRQRKFATSGT